MKNITKLLGSLFVCLALIGGTLFALPALADSEEPGAPEGEIAAEEAAPGEPAADPDEAVPGDEASADELEIIEDGGLVMAGGYAMYAGIALQIPDDYLYEVDEENACVCFFNEEGTVVFVIYDMSGIVPGDDMEWSDLFDLLAGVPFEDEELAESVVFEKLTTLELSEDVEAQAYGVSIFEGDEPLYTYVEIFVPFDYGFTLLVAGVDNANGTDEDVEECTDILATLTLGLSSDIDLNSIDFMSLLSGDIDFAFVAPDGIIDAGDGYWIGLESDIAFMTFGPVLQVSQLANIDLSQYLGLLAAEMDGEFLGSGTIETQDTTIMGASYSYTEAGTLYYLDIVLIPCANGSVEGMVILYDDAAAALYLEALTEMLQGVTLL